MFRDSANGNESARAKLKADPLAPLFIEIRNASQKRGLNPLNQVSLDHLREDLVMQLRGAEREHVLVLPSAGGGKNTLLVDALEVSKSYFASLVSLVFECYERFKYVVDPKWYFTCENFSAAGKTFEDAVSELGFPPEWASCALRAVNEKSAWRILREEQSTCSIDDLFLRYVGNVIPSPDSTGDKR